MQDLLDQCRKDFQRTLTRRRSELSAYFALYGLQQSLWNWGLYKRFVQGDRLAVRQAAFMASQVGCLKLAALPEPFAPPNGARDYWDRLFSLAAGDEQSLMMQSIRLPGHMRNGADFSARLNRLIDAALTGSSMPPDEPADDFHRMKPLYGGILQTLAAIVRRDALDVRNSLERLTGADTGARGLAWMHHRDRFCPIAFGIARLAQTALGATFEALHEGRCVWWDVGLMTPLPQGEQDALLHHLDRITSGFGGCNISSERSKA